jgi:DNA-binding response OmpR family regulator
MSSVNIGPDGPAKRVLVVDDSSVNLKITAALIRRAGFLTGLAETAEDALKQIAVELPDLIVTDLRLPGMDGLDLTRAVKKNPAWKHIPVILLTGDHSKEQDIAAREAGCECSLGKPVDAEEFPETIRAFLGASAPAAGGAFLESLPIEELRKEFLSTGAAECREILSQFGATRAFAPELDFVSIRNSLHRWAGAGGTLGFPQITRLARELETLLATFHPNQRDELRQKLAELLDQFRHAVPVSQPIAAPRKENKENEVTGIVEGPTSVKPVVLVGDDDAALRAVIRLALERAGFECRLAADGLQTYTMALDNPPDVIILDLHMPRLNGFQVLRRLRREWSTYKIPVIFLTASREESDIIGGAELGADGYMIKPFNTNDLLARLEQVIAASKRS